MNAHLFNTSWECGVVFVCRPCSRCSGPVDRSVGYPTTGLCLWDAAAEAGEWVLLDLYVRFCILDAVFMYFSC